MKTIVAEKLTLNRSILGWATVPCDASNHPLLSALQGDCPRSEWAHIECRDVADAIAEIKAVAKDMGITVQACGNVKRNPTIILRSKRTPASCAILTSSRASSEVIHNGFSEKTCFPARRICRFTSAVMTPTY